ncbi:MAG: T9SS type A sorting domain-containing protein [Lewinellaceae bacterium]|nr:T9SS type A sorting domain-containing protein [Lewinellaceae bacterium]
MKKALLLPTLFAAASGFLFAQPLLSPSDLYSIGDVIFLQDADTAGVNPGNGGANLTWDFSNLQPLNGMDAVKYTYLAPASTPYSSTFPGANLAVKIDFDTIMYGYAIKEPNQYTFLGIKNAFLVQYYTNPDVQLKPLSYNGSFQEDFANYTDSGSGVIFYAEGSRTTTYDGYGTLITPSGTFPNAIRIKAVSSQVDSAEFDDVKIINNTDITTYDWFVPNQPGVALTVYYTHTISSTFFPGFPPFVTDFGVVKSVNYTSDFTTGVNDQRDRLAGIQVQISGANPVSDLLSLQITADAGRDDLQMLIADAGGRVLESRVLPISGGQNRIDLPVSHFQSGTYVVTLTDGRGVQTLRWIKI